MSNTLTSAGAFGQLDPGRPPRHRKRTCCSSIIGRLYLVIAGLWVAWLCYLALRRLVKIMPDPHADLYQDLNVHYQSQDVVQPLVDRNQTFDIVATIWIRTATPTTETLGNSTNLDGNALDHGTGEREPKLEERVIFSDTVFRGLRLKDKNMKTSVKLQVPTEIFKRRVLNNYDLRASFVLVPQSPSLLDHAVSYKKWRPVAARYPPVRPETKTRTLQEQIVGAYGTFIPLLSFHNIESGCPALYGGQNNENEAEEEEAPSNLAEFDESRESYISTQGKPVLKAHPYIITRSFLRVVDVTKLYNKEAYEIKQLKLKATSCGPRLDWRDCKRSFSRNGNQEVKIKLLRRNETTGEEVTEWAYAPYLSLSRSAWGPLDLVPVPVNREDCLNRTSSDSPRSKPAIEEDSVSITWNIGFAGRTPRKLLVADWIGSTPLNMANVNMTDTVVHRPIQWLIEHAQSVGGHQHREDYHPRRVMILKSVTQLFSALGGILDILYWSSRSSTVGISTLGIKLVAAANIFQIASMFLIGLIRSKPGVLQVFMMFAVNMVIQLRQFLMLKTVTRAEAYMYKRWIPAVRFAKETHAERSSRRMGSRTSLLLRTMIYLVIATIFSVGQYYDAYMIDPTYPDMFPRDTLLRIDVTLMTLTANPAIVMGWILQIILNARTKRFAGMYALGAYFGALEWLLQFANRSGRIAGKSWDSGGFGYYPFAEGLCYAILAVQALRYPRISPSDEDEDSQ